MVKKSNGCKNSSKNSTCMCRITGKHLLLNSNSKNYPYFQILISCQRYLNMEKILFSSLNEMLTFTNKTFNSRLHNNHYILHRTTALRNFTSLYVITINLFFIPNKTAKYQRKKLFTIFSIWSIKIKSDMRLV